MPNSPSANPTPITPPRVPMLDPRTGLIDRAWYMFFLSLFTTASNAQDPALGPDTSSLLASFDAELRALSDEVGTQYDAQSGLACLAAALAALDQQFASQPSAEVGELQQQIDALRQEVQTYPQPALGTMAQLQQANVPWLTFDTTAQSVPTDIGTVAWDGGTTLGVQATANVLMRVGEAEYVYVKASSAITKGQLCYHTGAVGASGVITAAPTPLSLADPTQILGVAAESIALNGFGLIQISGDLRGFNTTGSSVGETWADGDPLYYNPSYVGSFTKTKPSAPNQKTYVGEVINAGAGSSGAINVRIIPGSVLGGTDSNVQFSALANGDLIQYDSALQYWKNVPASTLPVGTATNLAGGAAGSVPYQSAPSTTTFLGIGAAGRWLGSSGTAPQWNAPAALTKTDDTNVTLTLGGSASTALLNAASLTLGWTGQLAVSRGGTGVSTATANYVFAGPTSGGAAAPAFRALVAGDIPALSYVSSVSATAPITSTGGLTPTIGVTSAALTKTDDTNVTLTLGGSPTTALLAATSLTLGWTGTLAVGRGGLGISTTPSNGFVPIGNGTNYTAAALTAGTGITITNAAGSVTIAATAGGGSAPITKTANFSVANGESWYINNKTGSACTVTLPAASSFTGRELTFVNYQAQTLISASSNVVPLGGGSAGTAILAASVGDWATLVSDGTNWIIMQAAANNCLLLE
jgi:hypothetical protein